VKDKPREDEDDLSSYFRDLKGHFAEVRNNAHKSRMPQFREVKAAGYPARELNEGTHWKVGPLNIWPTTGRWWNEKTKQRGRIGDQSIMQLVEAQGIEKAAV
jgi:hypothetical protein